MPGKWIPRPSVATLERLYTTERRSVARIAVDFRCSETTVQRWLAEAGIETRAAVRPVDSWLRDAVELLASHAGGLTVDEIRSAVGPRNGARPAHKVMAGAEDSGFVRSEGRSKERRYFVGSRPMPGVRRPVSVEETIGRNTPCVVSVWNYGARFAA